MSKFSRWSNVSLTTDESYDEEGVSRIVKEII